jgi:hypothetical protein
MLLVYYRLYITYTLAVGFLFDLDKYNLKRYTKDWRFDKKMFTNSTKDIQIYKKTTNTRRSW